MRSSYPLSLFSGPPQRDGAPSAAVVSLVLHGVILAVVLASTVHVRVVHRQESALTNQVRLIDLRAPSPDVAYYPSQGASRRVAPAPRALSSGGGPQKVHASQVARASRNFRTSRPAPQTLIQPDVPMQPRAAPLIPIPQVVVWTPGKIVSQKIVTPAPAPLATIRVHPTLAVPNAEPVPSDVALTATPFTSNAPLPRPGTPTPIDVTAQQRAQQIPMTVSRREAKISPARVLSISNLKLDGGTAALPAINEIAAAPLRGSPSEGVSAGGSPDGSGPSGGGSGQGNGSENSAGTAPSTGRTASAQKPASGPGFTVIGGDDGAVTPDSDRAEHITLSPSGHYGMVITGASPQENYPGIQNLWTGRLVHTVYLRTNTAQSWILQYSLLRASADSSADPPGEGSGSPAAPWAFNIMRPDLGSYSGAVLVHGFITTEGRFAKLSVAFPSDFSKAVLLLRALKLWRFRPATVAGQPAMVEALLIVPGSQN